MKKKSLLAIILCMTMLFSTVGVYAAEIQTRIVGIGDERTIGSGSVTFVRDKALRGRLTLTCNSFSTDLDYIKATITIERQTSSGWSQYQKPYDAYGDAETGTLAIGQYIDVDESGTYRAKVVFEDKVDSIVNRTSAKYSYAASL